MKKLLITASTFPRFNNDTEPRFILDMAKALSKYVDVTVLVPADPKAAEDEYIEGIHVKRYHYFPIHSLETLCYPGAIVPRIKEKKARVLLVPCLFFALYRQLRRARKNYNAVYANWLIPQGIVQSFVKMPYLVTGHGGDVTSLNNGLILRLKKRCLARADAVTAVSEPLMKVMNSIYYNPNQSVISMGCNTQLFGKQYYIKDFFKQQGKPVILFVGRLAEKKGVAYLIDAMKYISMECKLVIVGSGLLESKLKKQAKETGKDIVFLGPKTHEELRTIYASADIFAMPSITAADGDKEGFGLVMLEAFASGLPVVASNSGGIVDVVKDRVNGLLVAEKDSKALAEQLTTLIKDKQLYDKLSENAVLTAQQYDYSVIAKKYYNILKSIMN